MVDYSYDRDDIYPPDFRDDLRERYYDRSKAENDYYEYFREQRQRRSDPYYEMFEQNSRTVKPFSTRMFWDGYGHGQQEQQVDLYDDDMSQLQNPDRYPQYNTHPFNLYRVRRGLDHWF